MRSVIQLGGHAVGPQQKLLVIAGPDVIESEKHAMSHAETLASICQKHAVSFVFKCSYDKANRTSVQSFRGPGLRAGLEVLAHISKTLHIPVLTDVHETAHVEQVAQVVDIIQVPAFLCRQTDLVVAVAKSGRGVNIKKGQFVSPKDMHHQAEKAYSTGNKNVLITERGASFGYNNLVVDMRGFEWMRNLGLHVCFDGTHSVQTPSSNDGTTGGERTLVPVLARAAAAAGIDALFTEVHQHPDQAPCDGPCSLTFDMFDALLADVVAIRKALQHQ
jgi:2-dehydro-3-deoxyphosphooctonate aldolase (KDO 8-P synthase)